MTELAAIRWGILATGKIAHAFAARPRAGARTPRWPRSARAAGVAPRRSPPSTAPRRARTARTTTLVADPDVDVVYVATPHALHLEHARLAFEAGKPCSARSR